MIDLLLLVVAIGATTKRVNVGNTIGRVATRFHSKSQRPNLITFFATAWNSTIRCTISPFPWYCGPRRAESRVEVFEVPLVYHTLAAGEHYEIQRMPADSARRPFRYHLTSQELRAKIHARDKIYLSLRDQAGPDSARIGT